MFHNTCTDHIQIDIDETTHKMTVGFNCNSMIAIFPESAFSLFSLIIFLCSPASYQLNTFGNSIFFGIDDKEVNVI